MSKPSYNAVKKHLQHADKTIEDGTPETSAIVFVSDRKQARLTALDFVTFTAGEDNPK